MCVQHIGGCSVHRGVFSTSGDTMSTLGDIMSTSGVFSTSGNHDACGEQVGKNLSIPIENPDVLNIPQCTHDIPPMY